MYRILIADDEMIEKMVLHKTLNDHFGEICAIYEAENGRRALEIFAKEKIQIAILDIEMPGINGIEAAAQMKKENPECCIIFLTAFDEFAYAKQAISIKAMEYLLKPYNEAELLLVVEEAMRITDKNMARDDHETQQETQLKEEVLDGEYQEIKNAAMMEKISEYIEHNYMNEISMQDVARNMNYSDAYFSKIFKQYFNQTFTSYLAEYRVKLAKQMLENPINNVKDIGEAVGYSDSNYFTKVFKRITGMKPTEYRTVFLAKNHV